jgi:hypothetical protein
MSWLAGLLIPCLGQDSPEGQTKIRESEISMIAKVEAINHETRKVTLRGPEGNTVTFKVDKSVKNLDQVNAGDQIVVHYYESVAVEVIQPGSEKSGQERVVESSEPGEKPAGASLEKTTVVATVEAINRMTPSITLKDSAGKVHTIKVRHPERLKLVKIGDTLKITFWEAVAMAVEPAPKSAR